MSYVAEENAIKQNQEGCLYSYQENAVRSCFSALLGAKRALLVAPTSSGKTRMAAEIVRRYLSSFPNAKVLVFQHRKEILEQNKDYFYNICKVKITEFSQKEKDLTGQVVMGMVQTLFKNVEKVKAENFDLIVVDETHHIVTKTYTTILNTRKKYRILGITATPERADKKSLKDIFPTITHQVFIKDLVNMGYCSPIKTFVIDSIGSMKMQNYIKKNNFSKASQIDKFTEKLLKSLPYLGEMLSNWKKYANGLKTIVFCPTNKISREVNDFLNGNGYLSNIITHKTNPKERASILKKFEDGQLQFISNTLILTEGWNCPSLKCIVLLRSSKHISTHIQMVGRGNRSYPGKDCCILLDFGAGSYLHGTFESWVVNEGKNINCKRIITETSVLKENSEKELKKTEKDIIKEINLSEVSIVKPLFNGRPKFESIFPFLEIHNPVFINEKFVTDLEKSKFSGERTKDTEFIDKLISASLFSDFYVTGVTFKDTAIFIIKKISTNKNIIIGARRSNKGFSVFEIHPSSEKYKYFYKDLSYCKNECYKFLKSVYKSDVDHMYNYEDSSFLIEYLIDLNNTDIFCFKYQEKAEWKTCLSEVKEEVLNLLSVNIEGDNGKLNSRNIGDFAILQSGAFIDKYGCFPSSLLHKIISEDWFSFYECRMLIFSLMVMNVVLDLNFKNGFPALPVKKIAN